jgi:osmotically-inducible protein OsmY
MSSTKRAVEAVVGSGRRAGLENTPMGDISHIADTPCPLVSPHLSGVQFVQRQQGGTTMQGAEPRSDESIREEIRASLTRRPNFDASGVEVEVEGGEVTLTGRVEDRDARWLAEDLVESVPGVSLVHNRLRAADG